MDYSLLIGIHNLMRGNKENIRDSTLQFFEVMSTISYSCIIHSDFVCNIQPDTKRAERRASLMKRRQSKAQVVRKAIAQTNPERLDSSELPENPYE